jgi:hypothetical protein
MIIGWVKCVGTRIDDSPQTRTELVYSVNCDCGCEYQCAIVIEDEMPVKEKLRCIQETYQKIHHWLQTDRHGSQLRPSPSIQNRLSF